MTNILDNTCLLKNPKDEQILTSTVLFVGDCRIWTFILCIAFIDIVML